MDEDGAVGAALDLEGALADHLEADVLQNRHAARQGDRLAVVVDLERGLLGRLVGMPVVVDGDGRLRADGHEASRIEQRLGGGEGAAVAFGQTRRDRALRESHPRSWNQGH